MMKLKDLTFNICPDAVPADIPEGYSGTYLKTQVKKDVIDRMYNIYKTIERASAHLENTRAIVKTLQYLIHNERQNNPVPPSVDVKDEHLRAIEHIRKNIIAF